MYISDEKECIFLCLPNSGSRTVSGWMKQFGAKQHYHHHNFVIPKYAHSYFVFAVARNPYAKAVSHWSFLKNHNHPRIGRKLTFPEYAEWTNDPKLRPVVKPAGILFDQYIRRYKKVDPDDVPKLKEYLLEGHARLQGRTMTSSKQLSYAHHVDQVLHLESLNEGLQSLPFVDDETVKVKHGYQNRREHRGWQPYYTAEAEEHIYEYFKQDFEAFGYERFTPNTSPSPPHTTP